MTNEQYPQPPLQDPASQQPYPQQPVQQPVMQQQWDQGAVYQEPYVATGQLAYQQPVYSTNYQVPVVERPNQPSSLGSWILTIIVSFIPVIGVLALLVWAFGDTDDLSKKRWAQAMLILYVVAFAIAVAATAVFGLSLFSVTDGAM